MRAGGRNTKSCCYVDDDSITLQNIIELTGWWVLGGSGYGAGLYISLNMYLFAN